MIVRTFAVSLLLAAAAMDAWASDPAAQVSSLPAAGVAAAPAAPAAADPAPAAAATADPNEKVCKLERQLGSNKMGRVCRTRAQIDAERAAAREALSNEQKR